MDEEQEQKTEPELEPEIDANAEQLFEAKMLCEQNGYIVATASELYRRLSIGIILLIITGLTIGAILGMSAVNCS